MPRLTGHIRPDLHQQPGHMLATGHLLGSGITAGYHYSCRQQSGRIPGTALHHDWRRTMCDGSHVWHKPRKEQFKKRRTNAVGVLSNLIQGAERMDDASLEIWGYCLTRHR